MTGDRRPMRADPAGTPAPAYRRATPADIPGIMALRGAVRENRLRDPSRVTAVDCLWFVEHSDIWVCEVTGLLAGFSAADPRDGSIWALFLDPAFEGRGLGTALLARACDTLRAAGHSRATLGTEPGTRAEGFYRHVGWTPTGRPPDGEAGFSLEL